MHAARAIKANREKRGEEKLKVDDKRRPSATSQSSRGIPKSPAVSVDAKNRIILQHQDDSDNLKFSYIGFIIAVFGAVPLIVGTFVEVPALWEIGLGVTLVGLFIGIVFWCTELCAEAKKFSQKKNQLQTRGKIEDSNLLQVPERKKPHHGNGVESRRGSYQSDSLSLITPMAQSFGSPKHLYHYQPNVHQHVGQHPIPQYSYDLKSEDSGTIGSQRANGNLAAQLPQPKLLLRGTRKDDSRVVSLVQPDPGLDDDSDSDAETVIEAPAGKPKIIQVQTLLEKGRQGSSGVLLGVEKSMIPDTSYHIENEAVHPFAQHRTIRMPVLPQEVDKLQRCECGRYLLTETDKLLGIRLQGLAGGSSMPATAYNSPCLAGTAVVGAGTAPASRKVFSGETSDAKTPDSSICSSVNDISSSDCADFAQSAESKIISVNPSMEGSKSGRQTSSAGSRKSYDDMYSPSSLTPSSENDTSGDGGSVVQVEAPLNSSDLLVNGDKTESSMQEEESSESGPGEDTSFSEKSQQILVQRVDSSTNTDAQLLEELLEIIDDSNLNEREQAERISREGSRDQGNDEIPGDNESENVASSSREQRREYQRSNSASRPTTLPLPVSLSSFNASVARNNVGDSVDNSDIGKVIKSPASSASIAFIGEQGQPCEKVEAMDLEWNIGSEPSSAAKSKLLEEISLDELLDQLEEKEEDEVLAVVVQ